MHAIPSRRSFLRLASFSQIRTPAVRHKLYTRCIKDASDAYQPPLNLSRLNRLRPTPSSPRNSTTCVGAPYSSARPFFPRSVFAKSDEGKAGTVFEGAVSQTPSRSKSSAHGKICRAFIDGELARAVSLCGITPIELMLEIPRNPAARLCV
jgi:hypothetical protein